MDAVAFSILTLDETPASQLNCWGTAIHSGVKSIEGVLLNEFPSRYKETTWDPSLLFSSFQICDLIVSQIKDSLKSGTVKWSDGIIGGIDFWKTLYIISISDVQSCICLCGKFIGACIYEIQVLRYFLEGITTFVSLLLPYFTTRRFVHLLRSRVPARLLLLRFRYATFVFFVIIYRSKFVFAANRSVA